MADQYLLESGAGDGYLLEDGTGTLLLEGGQQPINTRIVGPQYCAAREVAGYALAFAALGALLASPSATVGASEYTVGTHQAAVAESQPKPQLWGPLPPETARVGRPIIIGPQEYADLAAYVHGTAPPDNPRPLLKTSIAPPQQADDPYARLWGPQPEGIDRPPAKTAVVPPQQSDDPYGRLWGPEPEPLVVADVAISKVLLAPPQQADDPYGKTFGASLPHTPPASVIGGADFTVGTHQEAIAASQPAPQVWGPFEVAVAAADTVIGQFTFAAPSQVESGDTWVWSTTNEAEAQAEAVPPRPLIAVPPQQDAPGSAKLWGLEPTTASALIGRTLIVVPAQPDHGYALLWKALIVEVVVSEVPPRPPIVVPPQEIPLSYGKTWGPTPETASLDPLTGKNRYIVAQQYETDIGWTSYALTWGTAPDSVAPEPPVEPPGAGLGGGGGGGRIWYRGRLHRCKLEDQPLRHLDAILDTVIGEYYADILDSGATKAEKAEAGRIVKPFTDAGNKTLRLTPDPAAVNWTALRADAIQSRKLLELWIAAVRDREIDDDDDEMMLLH